MQHGAPVHAHEGRLARSGSSSDASPRRGAARPRRRGRRGGLSQRGQGQGEQRTVGECAARRDAPRWSARPDRSQSDLLRSRARQAAPRLPALNGVPCCAPASSARRDRRWAAPHRTAKGLDLLPVRAEAVELRSPITTVGTPSRPARANRSRLACGSAHVAHVDRHAPRLEERQRGLAVRVAFHREASAFFTGVTISPRP